ncbi:MAG: glycosyltransferase, partial [Kiritimatiellales bacterium]|nr:glycosyltransferase [Kiritimatiellales bacterium]
ERSYDAVHAVDEVALFAAFIGIHRKAPVMYHARRCFSGPAGYPPSVLWKIFPAYFGRLEKKVLVRSSAVFSHSPRLSLDLKERHGRVRTFEFNDVPLQSLVANNTDEPHQLKKYFEVAPSHIVVFRVLSDTRKELGKTMRAVRKIADAVPATAFFIIGQTGPDAENMAASLDVKNRCAFLEQRQTEEFLAALDVADVSVLLPDPDGRYVHEDVYTLLRAAVPLVAVKDAVYDDLLNSGNSIAVLSDAASIADGVVQAIQEPLFSRSLAAQGQQLIADRFSYSSFRHKFRMACNEVFNKK